MLRIPVYKNTDRFIADVLDGGQTHISFLWEIPREDFSLWTASGLRNTTFDQYRNRLYRTDLELRSRGFRVERVQASVSEVAQVIRQENLISAPAGVSNACCLIFFRRISTKSFSPVSKEGNINEIPC